jgi:purine-nucleoside phosphorylase
MSTHIGAEKGQIAPVVLLPGDPMRAEYFSSTMLEDVICFNRVRGMLGFTGYYQGQRVSVMGTGMGMPSLSIYVNELIREYDVKTLIRVGTCGGFQPDLMVGDILLAMAASRESNINRLRFGGLDFAPCANFDLLLRAYKAAEKMGVKVRVGGIFSNDTFYKDDEDWWKQWADYGVLGCEMETAELYTLAAKYGVKALSILTVSDSLANHGDSSSEQRERGFPMMAKIALEASLVTDQ